MSDDNLIPNGWRRVESGTTCCWDKYWSPEKLAWLPITVNSEFSGEPVGDFAAVIRKER